MVARATAPLGIRYSFTLAALTAVGLAVHWDARRSARPILLTSEKLLIGFLFLVWLSTVLGAETVGKYSAASGVDHPSIKYTKVAFFALMMTHTIVTLKDLNRLLWALSCGAMILGMQAWSTPLRHFHAGV